MTGGGGGDDGGGVSFDFGRGLHVQPWSAGCATLCLRSGRTGGLGGLAGVF